jgi:hypothetical protein
MVGQVSGVERLTLFMGKKRYLLEEYTKLARESKWEEAYKKGKKNYETVANILNKAFMQNLARTASYASSVAAIKACGFGSNGFKKAGSYVTSSS